MQNGGISMVNSHCSYPVAEWLGAATGSHTQHCWLQLMCNDRQQPVSADKHWMQ
jgi:hypothetical protein